MNNMFSWNYCCAYSRQQVLCSVPKISAQAIHTVNVIALFNWIKVTWFISISKCSLTYVYGEIGVGKSRKWDLRAFKWSRFAWISTLEGSCNTRLAMSSRAQRGSVGGKRVLHVTESVEIKANRVVWYARESHLRDSRGPIHHRLMYGTLCLCISESWAFISEYYWRKKNCCFI